MTNTVGFVEWKKILTIFFLVLPRSLILDKFLLRDKNGVSKIA